MKFKSRLCLLTSLSVLFLSLLASGIQAQQSIGIALSPPTFELSANPGDILENTIRVENLNDVPISVSVKRQNFTALGEEGSVGLTEEETPFSLASWMTVIPEEAGIPAKGNKTFTFITKIPLNAEPGGHFGSLVFRVGGQKMPTQTGAAVAQQLGSLILLRVAGETQEMANLESFVPQKPFWEYGPVDFAVRVKNSGNIHIKPKGTVAITNIFGKEVAKFPIDPRNVLPGAIRKIPAVWNQKFLLGKYTAAVSLTYGSQGQILTASTTFIGFPYKIGGLILAGLVILGAILYRARRRIKLALKILFSGKR